MRSASLVLLPLLFTAKLALSQGEPYTVNPSDLSPDRLEVMNRLIFERYTGSKAMQEAIEEHIPIWRGMELEAIDLFPWRRKLTFRFLRDNSVNAFYRSHAENGLPEIRVDYSYIEKIAKVYRDKGVNLKEWGLTPEQLACYEIDSTLAHELGHAVHSEFGLPAVGRHEDVADQFGLLWLRRHQGGMLPAAASVKHYMLNKGGLAQDTHAFDEQRAYEALSMLHGFAPNEFSFVKGLIGDRAERTGQDSENLRKAWNKLLQPVVGQDDFFVGNGAWGGNTFSATNSLNIPINIQVKTVAFDFSVNRLTLTLPPCSMQDYPSAFSAFGSCYVSINPIPGKDLFLTGINVEKVFEKGNGWLNTVYKADWTPDNAFQVNICEKRQPVKNRMWAGEKLVSGSLESANGRYKLTYSNPGGLKIIDIGGQPIWSINTATPATLFLDGNGRLHLDSNNYDSNNVYENPELWEIPAQDKIGEFYLIMRDDGNLVLCRQDVAGDTPIWSSKSNTVQALPSTTTLPAVLTTGTVEPDLPVSREIATPRVAVPTVVESKPLNKSELLNGEVLLSGTALTSASGEYSVVCQNDGNLVLYRNTTRQIVWASQTQAAAPVRLELEPGGSLVLRDEAGHEVWRPTLKDGDNPDYSRSVLRLADNGILVLFSIQGSLRPVRWSSQSF